METINLLTTEKHYIDLLIPELRLILKISKFVSQRISVKIKN